MSKLARVLSALTGLCAVGLLVSMLALAVSREFRERTSEFYEPLWALGCLIHGSAGWLLLALFAFLMADFVNAYRKTSAGDGATSWWVRVRASVAQKSSKGSLPSAAFRLLLVLLIFSQLSYLWLKCE
ncbi:MAG: hypothetical protein K0U93_29240 [Gammaproteobacteria bacterium]|nr:hypothetical protein [Gammaproteobacteria bacterium]